MFRHSTAVQKAEALARFLPSGSAEGFSRPTRTVNTPHQFVSGICVPVRRTRKRRSGAAADASPVRATWF